MEEPLVFTGNVLFFEDTSDFLLDGLLLGGILQVSIIGREGTLQVNLVSSITSDHEVGEVDDLDEWGDLGALGNALLAHGASDTLGCPVNADNHGVAILAILGAEVTT